MYYCQKTKKLIGPKISQVKVVIATRPRTYVNQNNKTNQPKTSIGWEIVKEMIMSPDAAREYNEAKN